MISVTVVVMSTALLLAMVLNLALKPSFSARLTTICMVIAFAGGVLIYGVGFAESTGDIGLSMIRTPFCVIKMFVGINDYGSIEGTSPVGTPFRIVLFWIIHLLAFYSMASAAMFTLGEEALRYLRMVLSAKGDLTLIYGINDRSIDLGKECRKARAGSVVFIAENADHDTVTDLNNMGMSVISGPSAVSSDKSVMRKLRAGRRRINVFALDEEDKDLFYALGLKDALKDLVTRFDNNIAAYKDAKNAYNEHSCRIEYIDPFLQLLGWDVPNRAGLAPQYREVIAENYSNKTDRPDYSLTLRGVTKLFVEAKKPSVDINIEAAPAIQTRKYGWNAKHKVSVLTNFEYFIIYDTTTVPKETDDCRVSRYRCYHYKDYLDKFDEIFQLVSKESVYSGAFDKFFNEAFKGEGSQKQQVDNLFLKQINDWRVKLSNELYSKGNQYTSLDTLNDVVQEFINQIVFLRICEDRNLPLYHKLNETISDRDALHTKLEELFREADKRYNSGMFSGDNIIFDLNNNVIVEMIKGLYYPQSPYMFNIIEPNMLGKIYELFLTEQLILLKNGMIGLAKKKDCANRSVVTTPTEIVKYMVEKSLSNVCKGKSPEEICNLRIADIACGSGVYLEEAFQYLQAYCVEWYLANEKDHLIEIGNGKYKLPLDEKKQILCSCIFGIDIDIHAVEVAKFSLLIKLIENETEPSVRDTTPILPELSSNILHGNALVGNQELAGKRYSTDTIISLVPYDWDEMPADGFDVILGNPPYVTTEDMHQLLSDAEFTIYKNKYKSSHKQFDKALTGLRSQEIKIKLINDLGLISTANWTDIFEKINTLNEGYHHIDILDNVKYSELLDPKVVQIYTNPEFLNSIDEYISNLDALLEDNPVLSRNFNDSNAESLGKDLEKNNLFNANHTIHLKDGITVIHTLEEWKTQVNANHAHTAPLARSFSTTVTEK